ncbi:hypothetical protein AB0I60_03325 [Actinosynnema sp. NPDC050436]|uniref:hypothetical protein n=1 Tax=Actinosynnema sp. NPDC050436 TaxID=3155659 RepID=UPI0034084A9C
MTEPDQADLERTQRLIDEAKDIARDLRETTPDPEAVQGDGMGDSVPESER